MAPSIKGTLLAILVSIVLAAGIMGTAPPKAEAHAGTCYHGYTSHYHGSYYWDAVYYAGSYTSRSGQHLHRYTVIHYYKYSSGWYAYATSRVTRNC